MKKLQVNSPEYRALVSSLLGKEVKFEDVPQIEIRKSPPLQKKVVSPRVSPPRLSRVSPPRLSRVSPPASPRSTVAVAAPPKKRSYIIIRTGYTGRLIQKFGAQEKLVRKGKGKNNDVYMISNPKEHSKLFSKVVFIYDKIWGKGLYSAAPLEETEEVFRLLDKKNIGHKKKVDLNGSVVFRVYNNASLEGQSLVYDLEDLDYCRMFIKDESYWAKQDKYKDSSEDEEEDEEDRDEPYEEDLYFDADGKKFRYIVVDAESG